MLSISNQNDVGIWLESSAQTLSIKGRGDIALFGESWPTQPITAFYDWLYLQALAQNPELLEQISYYQGFTDIAFNPQKSKACQARCAAMTLGLQEAGLWEETIEAQKSFLDVLKCKH